MNASEPFIQDILVRSALDGLADLLDHDPEYAPDGAELHNLLTLAVRIVHHAATGRTPDPVTAEWLAREAAVRLLATSGRPLIGSTDPRLPALLDEVATAPITTVIRLLRDAAHHDQPRPRTTTARPTPTSAQRRTDRTLLTAPPRPRRSASPCPCACTRPCGCGHAGCTAR
ncbi:hypothetical protein [Streptacidiphilus monticola]|uniref:Uncharacterized protein n=1 Tax=Streptacidiphilus monticola TaxID=2161674 RepID=A0ABW1GCE4_9ACTN